MAGTIQGVEVLEGFIREYVSEQNNQDTQKFNGASNGTIILSGVAGGGDYGLNTFVKRMIDAQYRRDPSSTASVSGDAYEEGQMVKVKVAGGFYITIPDAVLMWAGNGEPSGEVAQALSAMAQQYSEAIIEDQLNTLIAGGVAAIENNTSVVSDVSQDTGDGGTNTPITQARLNGSLRLFGDKSNMLVANVMHSTAYHDLIDASLSSSTALFELGGIAIREGGVYGQGRPIIVTDAPALKETITSVGDDYDVVKTLSLVNGALVASNAKQIIASNVTTGNQNISRDWQANYDFMAMVKGYAWDTTNGGAYPTDGEIATGTNWDKVVTYDKSTAGTMLVTNVKA